MRSVRTAVVALALLSGTAVLAQPPATEVEGIEAVGKMVPVPKVGAGAPYYSPNHMEAEAQQAVRNQGCIAAATPGRTSKTETTLLLAETRIVDASRAAKAATLTAEEARRQAALGKADMAEVERTELARQAAVQRFERASFTKAMLGYDPNVDDNPPVSLEVTSATLTEIKGQEALLVRGTVRNIWRRRARIPVITVMLYDLNGNLVHATAAQPDNVRLKVGESRPFAVRVPNAFDAARVALAPGEHAAFNGRDFCSRFHDDAFAAAVEYWVGAGARAFNRAPNTPPGRDRRYATGAGR